MAWTRIDDQFHAHPKVQQAWHAHRASIGLYLLALSHAGAYLTDGHISEAFVRTQLPAAAERRRAVAALVDAGLWELAEGGCWRIHDYHDHNATREQMLARRRDPARTAAGGRSRACASGPASAPAGAPTPTPTPIPYR